MCMYVDIFKKFKYFILRSIFYFDFFEDLGLFFLLPINFYTESLELKLTVL